MPFLFLSLKCTIGCSFIERLSYYRNVFIRGSTIHVYTFIIQKLQCIHVYLYYRQTIHPSNILLRSAQLRNTDYVYGVSIYAGHDTKIMQNRDSVPLKRSHIDGTINKIVSVHVKLLMYM